jgi:type IV pilus assembly protein PilY1
VESWTGIIAQSKMEIAKQAISTLVASEAAVSWGFGTWAQFDPYPEPIPAKVASEADRTYTRIHVGCAPYTAAHLTKLQAAIANTTHQSGSDTPFAPSILGAKKYFGAQMPDDELKTFVSNSCQPKVLVNVTDGRGNVPVDVTGDAYLALVDSRVRELLASGVNAVGVGFGMGPEGDIRAQLQRLAELSNTEGRKSPADALYPLHLEDGNGKGLPYFAQNKGELSEALQVIASSVKQAVFYGSAPAGTSVSDLGSMVLVSSFSTSDWSGDLQAITRDDQKRWNNQLWRASENVPANRKIWTLNDSNQIVEYSGYNYFCKPFGDIINSQPVVVGPPPYFYRVNNYNTFVLDKRSHPREPMVYFGANDGLVHALRLADGVEQWAFLPKSVRQRLEQAPIPAAYDRCSPYYCHSYLLDGPPKLADVYENFGSVNKTWQTMLVIGQRSGGSSYTALAVTEGHPFGYDGYAPANHLWEFTDAKLGEAWSEPEIEVTAAYEDMCYPWKYTWGVFLGSGYFKNANDWNCQSAYVFGLKADTGTPMWRNQSGTPINKVELLASGFRTKNAACSPLVAYMNLASGSLCYANRAMPRIYVGDLYGTLYRLNGIHYGSNPHQTRLFQFDPWPTSPDVNPIRGKPTYAYGDKDDHIWIYYGTGRYETEADKTNAAQQYFFGLRELTAPALGFTNVEPTYNLSRLVPREVYNVDVTVNGVTKTLRTINGGNANGNSWYVKLKVPQSGGSERVFTKPLAVGGVVFFTTFIPDADGCSGSGDTYLFAIDYKTGLAPANPVMDINGDNKVNDADKVSLGGGNPPVVPVGVRLGRGQGSTPVLFKNTIFVTTTVAQYGTTGTENANLGGLHAVLVDLPNFKVRTESWKHNGNATEPVEGEL